MNDPAENIVQKHVTYTIQIENNIFVFENVPARVNEETGEQFFSPATVENIQQIITNKTTPDRMVEVPVYNYAA